jgi:hypothetical protein
MEQYIELLSWILPPVIGALIGYITNDIAIKMLFRPLRARYIGKMRLPFTPGIIPRQRSRLAESIGVMVSRELITEDALRRQIATESFRQTLDGRIRDLSAAVLYTPVNELPARFRPEGRGPAREDRDLPADTALIKDLLSAFFKSQAFFDGLQASLGIALDSFFQVKLNTLTGREGQRFFEFARYNINLAGLREPVKKLAGELTVEGIRKNTALSGFLSSAAIEGIINGMNRLYPSLARELLSFLRTSHIHLTLEQKGRIILRGLIDRMSSLQRLFIIAGQYNRNIEEQMDEIVDDALDQLEAAIGDDLTRQKILETLRSWLQKLSAHTLGDLAGIWGESLPADVEKGVDFLFDLLASPRVTEWGKSLAVKLITDYGDSAIGGLLETVTGKNKSGIAAVLADWVGSLIRVAEQGEIDGGTGKTYPDGLDGTAGGNGAAAGSALNFFKKLISALSMDGGRSIADILSLEESHKERLDRLLNTFVMGMIDTQVPTILESVDVHALVVEKINSLDIEKVEDLILIVIRTHLRYIILFGAVLGFLIGSLQVALTKLI